MKASAVKVRRNAGRCIKCNEPAMEDATRNPAINRRIAGGRHEVGEEHLAGKSFDELSHCAHCNKCYAKTTNSARKNKKRKRARAGRIRERLSIRARNGLCSRCDEPVMLKADGTLARRCEKHLVENAGKKRQIRASRVDSNSCIRCGKPAMRKSCGIFHTLCEKHRAKEASRDRLYRQRRARRLAPGKEQ